MILVQQGDQGAYGELFARWKGPMWSFLMRKTRRQELASDLFQEVFLRVWRSAGTFREGQPFRPWLYRVATNVARDRFRAETRTVDLAQVELERLGTRLDPIGGVDLERAIAALPETLRSAFVLGAVHGLDHREVGEALGITPANARARISRARAMLRNTLAQWQEEAP